jgi:hypothetical protein
VRPGDRKRFIEEVTEALAVAADTKAFAQLQRVLAAWAATIRLQRRPGYETTIRRMQRRSVACPSISTSCVTLEASLGALQIEQAEDFRREVGQYTDAERVILADA